MPCPRRAPGGRFDDRTASAHLNPAIRVPGGMGGSGMIRARHAVPLRGIGRSTIVGRERQRRWSGAAGRVTKKEIVGRLGQSTIVGLRRPRASRPGSLCLLSSARLEAPIPHFVFGPSVCSIDLLRSQLTSAGPSRHQYSGGYAPADQHPLRRSRHLSMTVACGRSIDLSG